MEVKTLNLLSLTGGGLAGYSACAVLAEIERRSGKKISEIFQLIGGTSIGGIVALSLAAGNSAADTLNFFTEDGPKIFKHSLLEDIEHFIEKRGIRAKFSVEAIETALHRCLGDKLLSESLTKVIITSFDLVAYEPFFFKSHDETSSYRMWQAGRATSAAETFFPAFVLDGKVLWDGGNIQNSPSVCVYAEAVNLWGDEQNYKMLSLGCGKAKSKFNPQHMIDPRIEEAAIEAFNLAFDGNMIIPNYIMKAILGNTYYEIQPNRPSIVTLSNASPEAIQALKDTAAETIANNSATIDEFCH